MRGDGTFWLFSDLIFGWLSNSNLKHKQYKLLQLDYKVNIFTISLRDWHIQIQHREDAPFKTKLIHIKWCGVVLKLNADCFAFYWSVLEILTDIFQIQSSVFTELTNCYKLMGFLFVVSFDLTEQFTAITFAFPCDALDVLRINAYPFQFHKYVVLKRWKEWI